MKSFKKLDVETERNMAWKVLKIIGMVILGIAVAILFGFVVMWLWNWLMPMIFGLTTITYWQAVGLFVLAKIIFGSFGSGSSDKPHSPKSPGKKIKGSIKHEIGKEIKKEFDKEFNKDHGVEEKDDDKDYDELYEQWWDKKGEKDFNEYMDDQEDA
ncbi:MAG: NADH-quinone oxidoreductase subunit K [Clostridiales bacterium]|nr:NADH-quinone oxidoreductase subunit K [Clostridiales bacterium]